MIQAKVQLRLARAGDVAAMGALCDEIDALAKSAVPGSTDLAQQFLDALEHVEETNPAITVPQSIWTRITALHVVIDGRPVPERAAFDQRRVDETAYRALPKPEPVVEVVPEPTERELFRAREKAKEAAIFQEHHRQTQVRLARSAEEEALVRIGTGDPDGTFLLAEAAETWVGIGRKEDALEAAQLAKLVPTISGKVQAELDVLISQIEAAE